jgi:ABC-type lipoprotein export system ATPase subunit
VALRPGLSTLIGINGSGKTNVLNAILLLQKVCNLQQPFGFKHTLGPKDEKNANRSSIDATFIVGGKLVRYHAEIRYITRENNQEDVVKAEEHWNTKEITGHDSWFTYPSFFLKQELRWNFKEGRRHMPSFVPEALANKKASSALIAIGVFISNINYYSAAQFTNPSECPASFEMENDVLRRSFAGGNEHRRFMFDLYSKYKNEPAEFSGFKSIVGRYGIGLVDDIDFDTIQISANEMEVKVGGKLSKKKVKRVLVVPHFIISRKNLSPSQLSEGTYKTLALLLYLDRAASSLLLLEEPEVCTHHGLLASIIEMLKSYSKKKQIIIATHSDFILDQVKPETVFIVKNLRGKGTVVKHLPEAMSRKDYEALKTYLKTTGNLGEYWRDSELGNV